MCERDPRYIGNRPQASLLHRDILTELRSFFLSYPNKTPCTYVTHTHTHAPGDWNIPLYIFFACFSLPTLGSSRIHYLRSYNLSPCVLDCSPPLIHPPAIFLTLPLNGQYLTFATHERKPGIISLKTVRESKNLSHPSLGIAALPTSYMSRYLR